MLEISLSLKVFNVNSKFYFVTEFLIPANYEL